MPINLVRQILAGRENADAAPAVLPLRGRRRHIARDKQLLTTNGEVTLKRHSLPVSGPVRRPGLPIESADPRLLQPCGLFRLRRSGDNRVVEHIGGLVPTLAGQVTHFV
ncbi:Uncharacterised protein [Mycobacteroides abscessus subsp. bolletii]|nr:Uncharacterised protein [Mycobacteroides abscessus subsp. bolletii]